MVCRECNKDLPEEKFHLRSKSGSKRHKICTECKKIYDKNLLDSKKFTITKWLKEEYPSCVKCNESRYHVLDFHHKDPSTKEIDISKLLNSTTSIETTKKRLEKELKGCARLCSNCHRDFHYLERNFGETIDNFLKPQN